MKITVDTNLLVRMATTDNEAQARTAFIVVSNADEAIVPLPCTLEFVWVLETVYRFSRDEIAQSLLTLLRMPNITIDGSAVDLGLEVHLKGGDFADGVIAAVGAAMGGEKFVSFDRKAVARLQEIGVPAELATAPA